VSPYQDSRNLLGCHMQLFRSIRFKVRRISEGHITLFSFCAFDDPMNLNAVSKKGLGGLSNDSCQPRTQQIRRPSLPQETVQNLSHRCLSGEK
jgi:hypothetical protein